MPAAETVQSEKQSVRDGIALFPFLDPQGTNHEHRGEYQERTIILDGQPDTVAKRDQQAVPGNRHLDILAGEVHDIEASQAQDSTKDKENRVRVSQP